jgi:hypothetical protein
MILAFTPLLDPVSAIFPGMSDYWLFLVVPLVIAISIVYRCTRTQDLRVLPREAAIMSTQIILVMALAALLLATGYALYIRLPFFR